MTNRERFVNVLNSIKPLDRLPKIEFASGNLWWDKTVDRWKKEGLPRDIEREELDQYFGLDRVVQVYINVAEPDKSVKGSSVYDMESYMKLKKNVLYPEDIISLIKDKLVALKRYHDAGDIVVWMTLEGFFGLARHLLGVERHMYTFYDNPGLIHKINQDLADYYLKAIHELYNIIQPDYMTFSEDMSYNNGSMISYDLYKKFMVPYYSQVIPVLKNYNIIPFIDSDGNVENIIPWFIEAGIEGVLPLERQAGCDVEKICKEFPNFRMIGGYDKMVMSKGEPEMRKEFERLLPVMKKGRFIPSVDHQTPPEVSLENYRIYLQLLTEYCVKAIE